MKIVSLKTIKKADYLQNDSVDSLLFIICICKNMGLKIEAENSIKIKKFTSYIKNRSI